jgi:hypothetical protein
MPPTPTQELLWQQLDAGAHVLIAADVDGGASRAACRWGIDRLRRGAWPGGSPALIYLAQPGSLESAIARDVQGPLAEAGERGAYALRLRVAVRDGTASRAERRRLLRHAPDILATTPEGLDELLADPDGRRLLDGVRALILERLDVLAAGTPGAWLMASVERLRLLAGDFQRIASTGGGRPATELADLLGGWRCDGRSRGVAVLPTPEALVPTPGGSLPGTEPAAAATAVLAQLVATMCAIEPWTPDRLYAFVRAIHGWHALPRPEFDAVVDDLLGRQAAAVAAGSPPRLREVPGPPGRGPRLIGRAVAARAPTRVGLAHPEDHVRETTPLPLPALPLFLADWQGLTRRGRTADALADALERLLGYSAPAALWESDLLPARVHPYLASWLDALLVDGGLVWVGLGRERLGFCPRGALPVFLEATDDDGGAAALLPEDGARADFFSVQLRSGLTAAELAQRLWAMLWRGRVANDAFAAVRRGVRRGFGTAPPAVGARDVAPFLPQRVAPGTWRRLRLDPPVDQREELAREEERALQVAERYGVLLPELLAHETPLLSWPRLQPALERLALAGELLVGRFVDADAATQYATPAAARRLCEPLPETAVWWLNAADPASCCGIELAPLRDTLPQRHAGIRIVYRGRLPALVLRRGGRALSAALPPDDPELPRLLAVMREWVQGQTPALEGIAIEEVDGTPSRDGPYAAALLAAGFAPAAEAMVLRRGT